MRIIVLTVLIYINTVLIFSHCCRIGFDFLALTSPLRVGKVECREVEKNKKLRTNYGRFLRGFDG